MNKVGIGSRVLNFLLDTFLFFWLAYIAYKIWYFYAFYYGIKYLPFYDFFYMMWFLYYVVCEGLFARTPGKKFTYTKVVNKSGGRPAFWQILVRSIVRLTIIDCFFIPFLDKPLHDALSKTEVVEA